jgi:hypothetical protein
MYEKNPLPRFVLREYLGWRSESLTEDKMHFWEQFALNIFQAMLSQLHFDPAKATLLSKILIPIRDTLNVLYPPNAPGFPNAK